MDILSTAAQSYMNTFSSYLNQFLQWGQWLFFSLLGINLVWRALWHAFDRQSLSESMPQFLKQFFVVTFFYTILMDPGWLVELLDTAQFMGSSLTHTPIDPSSIISAGIGIANRIIIPVEKSSLLTVGPGLIVIMLTYGIVLFTFISIALDLALTLIVTTALIVMSTFFLGFAALGATSQIARQTLEVVLAHCVKLLGLYCVVAAGSQTMQTVLSSIPTSIASFDPYAWIVSVALLFWLVAKHLPNQLAKIVTGTIQETRGTDAAAIALAAINTAQTVLPAMKMVSGIGAAQGAAKIAGSTAYNAGMQVAQNKRDTGKMNVGSALSSTLGDVSKAVGGNVADHFKDVAGKLAGGPGTKAPIQSVSERLYHAAKDLGAPKEGPTQTPTSARMAQTHPERRK